MSPGYSHFVTEFRVQRLAQQRERPEALDPPQAWPDVQERSGQPTLFLIGGALPIHLIGTLPDQHIQWFDTVGGLQTDLEYPEYAKAVQGQRLLQPLVEALDRRSIDEERPVRGEGLVLQAVATRCLLRPAAAMASEIATFQVCLDGIGNRAFSGSMRLVSAPLFQ